MSGLRKEILRVVERAKLSVQSELSIDRSMRQARFRREGDGAGGSFLKARVSHMGSRSIAAVTPGLATGFSLSLKRSLKRWQIQKTEVLAIVGEYSAARLHPGGGGR